MWRSSLFRLLEALWSVLLIGIVINLLSSKIEDKAVFFWAHALEICFVLFLVAVLTWKARRISREYQASQEFALFTPTEKLLPKDLDFERPTPGTPLSPHLRPYTETYIPRQVIQDDAPRSASQPRMDPMDEAMLVNFLGQQQDVILIGPPTEGKTRTLFELIKRLPGYHVVMPIKGKGMPSDDAFAVCKKRKIVLVLNDLNEYHNTQMNLPEFVKKVREQKAMSVVVAATCQDGAKLTTVLGADSTGLQPLYRDLRWKLRLVPSTNGQKKTLKESLGKIWQPQDAERFSTLGAIVMENALEEMRLRWIELPRQDAGSQDTLRAMKLLDAANIALTKARLYAVVRGIFARKLQEAALNDCLRLLRDQAFLRHGTLVDAIKPEPAYLKAILTYEPHGDDPTTYFPVLIFIWEEIKDVEALVALGGTFLTPPYSDVDNATAAFTVATHLDDTIPTRLFDEAGRLFAEAHYQEALRMYEYVLLLEPENAAAWTNKRIVLGRLGRFAEALAAFEQVLALKPDDPAAWDHKGVVLGDLGRAAEALAAVEQALALKLDSPLAWKNREDYLQKLGRQEEAQTEYERVALYADDPDLLRRVADLLEARGFPAQAARARVRAGELERKKREGGGATEMHG